MPHRPRRVALTAIALALTLLALWAPATGAQTTPPPATPIPVATPTPTRTAAELIGVDGQAETAGELLRRYGWLGALGLLMVGGAFFLLVRYWSGLGKTVEKIGERHAEGALRAAEAPAARRAAAAQRRGAEQSGVRAYLAWLQEECGVLPQKPLDVKDEELRLEQVYVPLRVWERDQMDRFVAYRLRDFADAQEAEARERAYSGFQQRQSVFRLLSDRDSLPEAAQPRRTPRRRPEDDEPPPEPLLCRRLLLVGEAGSGKTTTLHFGALMLASDYLSATNAQARQRLDLHTRAHPLPVYIRLTLLTRWLLERYRADRSVLVNRHAELVFEWLRHDLPRQQSAIPAELIPERIRAGGCLIMFDGLDETGDALERDFAKGLIANLVQACPDNRYVVASRPFSGVAHGLPGDFLERHLSPLDADEIQALLHKWFDAVRQTSAQKPRRSVDQEYDELWGRLQRSARLFDMATNPLLLTSMAILVHGGDSLPAQRAKIYKRLVDLTIIRWRAAELNRGLPPDARAVIYLEEGDEVRLRLQLLAAWMLRQQRREIALREAQDELGPVYQVNRGWGKEQCDIHIRTLMGLLALNSGLVQERDGRYSFIHFTLQEYLAARHYDELGDVGGLLARRHEQRWREAILLAIGHWCTDGLRDRAVTALSALLAPATGDNTLLATLLQGESHADLLLAAEALDEANAQNVAAVGAQFTACIAQLKTIAFDPDRCPAPVERNDAATLLDRFEKDQRPGLDLTKDDYWAARIAPGVFSMGDDKDKFDCRINRPYALARFPVTNRQYLVFVEALAGRGAPEATGAAQALLKLMAQHQQTPEQLHPRLWPGARYRAGEGNHPVVGVSWYAASAYAWWAEAYLKGLGKLAPGEALRLPTEAEWERAAAYQLAPGGADTRAGRCEYPWGDWPALTDMTKGSIIGNIRANIDESGIGGTSSVGIFPQGAAGCGAEELAGNVWEWCATPPTPYPWKDAPAAESLYTTHKSATSTYVLRGGSWATNRDGARCASRVVLHPAYDLDDYGFRLAHLFSLPSSS